MAFASKLLVSTAAFVFLASASPSSAAFFTAGTTPFSGANNCSGVQGGVGSAPISASAICSPSAGVTSQSEARATYGQVGASAQVLGGSSAFAVSSFQDTVMFTSTDPNAYEATVTFQFVLDGFMTAHAGAPIIGGPSPNAVSDVRASLFFNGQGPFTFDRTDTSDFTGNHTTIDYGNLSVASGNPFDSGLNLILTRSFLVPLNYNITYAFQLSSSASVFADGEASSLFSHTMGFSPGLNAFILPDGVTANAGDYLVNNRLVSGGVPEPASWALMIAGLGLTGAALRRRRTAVAT